MDARREQNVAEVYFESDKNIRRFMERMHWLWIERRRQRNE